MLGLLSLTFGWGVGSAGGRGSAKIKYGLTVPKLNKLPPVMPLAITFTMEADAVCVERKF